LPAQSRRLQKSRKRRAFATSVQLTYSVPVTLYTVLFGLARIATSSLMIACYGNGLCVKQKKCRPVFVFSGVAIFFTFHKPLCRYRAITIKTKNHPFRSGAVRLRQMSQCLLKHLLFLKVASTAPSAPPLNPSAPFLIFCVNRDFIFYVESAAGCIPPD
jgi:hypothetical protein